MEEKKSNKPAGIKTVIVILSVLLAVSVAAFVGTLIYRSVARSQPAAVTVPDNIISPEAEGNPAKKEPAAQTAESVPENSINPTSENTQSEPPTYETDPSASTAAQPTSANRQRKAAVISLYRNHGEDNQPFQVKNMFPGDAETKYYCVKISHSGDVLVQYRANVRPGYEKLAEVLRCRVVLLTTGETLYDGLMRDMPQSLDHSVKTTKSTESELYYEITAYLDTSVGNEYQNKDLIADFRWWVQDVENLDAPQTGDSFPIYLWVCLASGSMLILLFLVGKRRKEECENG